MGSSRLGHRRALVTLVFTDVVGSVALKQRLGDQEGINLIQKHHALVRETLALVSDAREIETAGDSFLFCFSTTSEAVRLGLLLQGRLSEFNREHGTPIIDRIGIHMGEVDIAELASGRAGVYGFQVDTCARVMSLAEGGQILMTRPVFDNARQSLKGEEIPGCGSLNWFNHGWYRLKGIEEPVEICEVRCASAAPAKPPTSSDKAERASADGELVLGWRPAVGLTVPNTQWVLEQSLGEGGFGEVWLASHRGLKEQRVFKFCFQADRVRSLKREVTLFRLLKQRAGEHPNIVRLYDVCFDQPPFYLEEEYIDGRDLKRWAEKQGGIGQVPLEARLEIVAQAAMALQAAHDSGIIHRDVKPGNILVGGHWISARGPTALQVKLTDFGIAQVLSTEALQDITHTGLVRTNLSSEAALTGTHLYMAPELVAGQAASIRSDIYGLGVVLYQVLVADFQRPVTTDWADDVKDPLLREDLRRCLAGNPGDRFSGAGQLADRLRALPNRRKALADQQAHVEARERAAYRLGIMRTAGIAGLILLLIAVLGWEAWRNGRAKIRLGTQLRSTTVRLAVANGLSPAENGDWLAALLWFSEAFVLDESLGVVPEPELTKRSHLMRINSVLRQSPRLEQMWFENGACDSGFDSTGTRVLLGTTNGYRFHSILSGEPVSPLFGTACSFARLGSDERRVVTGDKETKCPLVLWDAVSGTKQGALQEPSGEGEFRGACRDVQFSPDGKWVAAALDGEGGRIIVWDAHTTLARGTLSYTNSALLKWSTNDFICGLRFDASGKRLLTTGSDDCAVVWDWEKGVPLNILRGHRSWVYSGDFAHHTNWVVTCSFDQTAKVWDLQTDQAIQTVEHPGDAVQDVQFSPDDETFATAGLDFTVRLWKSSTGQLIPPILRNHDRVMQVQWSPDGARVLARTWDGTVRVWQLKAEKPPVEPAPGDCSEDGQRFLTYGHGVIRVQNANGGQDLSAERFMQTNPVSVTFAGTSKRFLSFSWTTNRNPGLQPQFHLRQLGSPAPLGNPLTCDPTLPNLARAREGNRFAFFGGTNGAVYGGGGHAVYVWEPEKSAEARKFDFPDEFVQAVALDLKGGRMAVATLQTNALTTNVASPAVVRLFDLEGKNEPDLLTWGPQAYRHLAFGKDDRWLVAARADESFNHGDAEVWYSAAPGQPFRLHANLKHLDGVLYAAFNDSGDAIATGSEDQTAIVWRRSATNTWEPSQRPFRCGGQVYLCAFSHNGRWLATAYRTREAQQLSAWSGHVRIWDLANNEAVGLPFTFPDTLTRLVFVGDDTRLFAEHWTLPGPPKRWLLDFTAKEQSPRELLLQAEMLSAQRSFLSGRVQHLPEALAGKISAEQALVHATSVGPLNPLSKEDCSDLWSHFWSARTPTVK